MIFAWLRRRKQLAVARRVAELKAQIAELESSAASADAMAKQSSNFFFDVEAAKRRREAAGLKVKLAHNLQHEDVL